MVSLLGGGLFGGNPLGGKAALPTPWPASPNDLHASPFQ